jgi:hypothetical protein
MTEEESEVSQSVSSSHTPKLTAAFEDYFKTVVCYGVLLLYRDQEPIRTYKIEGETIREDHGQNKELILQNLIQLAPSLSHFHCKMENSDSTYLEVLFRENLGWMAKEVCVKMNETGEKLPEECEILLKIYQGENLENSFESYPTDFINLAYKVANNAKNINMVEKLFLHSDVKEKAENLKTSHPFIYLNYIHEPYWSYNLTQLLEYGGRIIEKIKPYFVSENNIRTTGETVYIRPSPASRVIRVRQVQFGYVLPNLYLKEKLEGDASRAVPRIFLYSKGEQATFRFKMPYTADSHAMDIKALDCSDKAYNPIQVLSNDFVVYQEWIDGKGHWGNREFASLGHRDFNQVQIIKSDKDEKSYLIDTKEEKNFFPPYLSPFIEEHPCTDSPSSSSYSLAITGRDTLEEGKKASHAVMYDAKNLHFDPRVIFVEITIPLTSHEDSQSPVGETLLTTTAIPSSSQSS